MRIRLDLRLLTIAAIAVTQFVSSGCNKKGAEGIGNKEPHAVAPASAPAEPPLTAAQIGDLIRAPVQAEKNDRLAADALDKAIRAFEAWEDGTSTRQNHLYVTHEQFKLALAHRGPEAKEFAPEEAYRPASGQRPRLIRDMMVKVEQSLIEQISVTYGNAYIEQRQARWQKAQELYQSVLAMLGEDHTQDPIYRSCLKQLNVVNSAIMSARGGSLASPKPPAVHGADDEMVVDVVVASRDLAAGQKLHESNIAASRIPLRLIPQECGDVVRGSDRAAVLDMELNQDVNAGRILRFSYFRAGPSRAGGTLVPREGYRIIGLKMDRDTCPPQLPVGAWVDIVVRVTRADKLETIPVMERVLVKTVDASSQPGDNARMVYAVGVEVRADDAYRLSAFLTANPQIILLTRNPDEPMKLRGFNPDLIAGPPSSPGGHN